ncbi:hypothetical protein DXV76_12875 [Rhodobacteraceae bacterium CCMM004]|nr:hypothetical protein DXV76_12875 [Rhodobacteraceae bacterium CCMM004]
MPRRGTFTLETASGEIEFRDAYHTSDIDDFVNLVENDKFPIVLGGKAAKMFLRVHDHRREQGLFGPLMGGLSKILSLGSDRKSSLGGIANKMSSHLLSDDFNFDEDQLAFVSACDSVMQSCEFHYFGDRTGVVMAER